MNTQDRESRIEVLRDLLFPIHGLLIAVRVFIPSWSSLVARLDDILHDIEEEIG